MNPTQIDVGIPWKQADFTAPTEAVYPLQAMRQCPEPAR